MARGAGAHLRGVARVALLVMLAAATVAAARAQDAAAEYKVKAAFLFHFAQLVDWPADALDSNTPSVYLCLFEDDPHVSEFQRTLEGKPLGDRSLHVRSLRSAQDAQMCNILFVSRDESRHSSSPPNNLRWQSVLTIGETEQFLKQGGIIRFHLEDGRVRFDVNLAAADAARLRISSRLLLLASQVMRGSAGMDGGR